MFVPIIMAGGSGTRLWPLSRQLHPKQFLPLVDSQFSMLQATIKRLAGLTHASPQLICNEEHRFLAAEQLRLLGLQDVNILLEPMGRNTAPAIALAALQVTAEGADPLMLVLAADHLIQNIEAFHDGIRTAMVLAEAGKLVSFGITPTRPETGYGYLRQGPSVGNGSFTRGI